MHTITHEVGDRQYIIEIGHDSVSIRPGNRRAQATCISGYETIQSVCNTGCAVRSALTELWGWATCEKDEYLDPVFDILV